MILTPFNSISKIASAIPLIDKYNKGLDLTAKETQILDSAMKSSTFDKYVESIKDGSASLSGYIKYLIETQAQTLGATIKTKLLSAAMTALHMAANIAIVTLVSYGIEKLVEYFINLSHAQQDAINKANELTETYNNSIQTINSNITSLQGLQDEFATLSKGVDSNGKNIGLTTDQFKRYHEIVKQIVDIQPSLIKGFDDQNNAIVDNNSALQSAISYEQQQLELSKQNYLKDADKTVAGAEDEVSQHTENAKKNVKDFVNTLIEAEGKSLVGSKEYAAELNKVAINGGNESSNDIFNRLASNKIGQQLSQFGINYQNLLKGSVFELNKVVVEQDEIIAKIQKQNGLTTEQKTAIIDIVNKISTEANGITTANQKMVSLATTWASLNQNSSWYDKITQTGNLNNFQQAIDKFIQKNPSASIEQIENATYNLGTSFAKIQDQIPTNKISDLKKQLDSGKISTDDYNKQVNDQIISVEKVADSYEKTNPILAEFLKLISQGLADNFKQSSETDLSSQMSSILSNFDTQEKSAQTAIDTLADSLKDLNVAIDDNQKGTLLSGDTVSNLLSKYPILYKSIIDTGNGYKFVKGALEDVRKAQIKEQEDAIKAQIATAKQTLASTQDRIKAYAKEIGAISTLAQAQSRLAEMTQTTSIAIHDPNIRNGFDTESQEARAELAKYNEAKSELAAFANAADEIKKGQDEIGALEKQLSLIGSGNYQKTDQTAENKANKEATKAAQQQENTALKNAEALLDYHKQMGQYTSDNLFKQIQLNQEYLKAAENLKKYVKTTEEKYEVDEKIKSAQDELAASQKNYAQDVLDTSKKELQNRLNLGVILDNTAAKLNNLNEIYKNLTTNSMMSPVNTEENRAELEQEIYETKKGILEAEATELENEVNLGKIQEGTLEYLQRLQKIQSDISKSDLGTADKTTELQSINEKIYSARQSYNESQINEIDHLVSIGKLQENSLEYIQKLNSLYRSLNLTLEQRESLQEKIFSAEKSYISQLESDLMDESIEGSYGAQIKAVQDKIDAINKENDATSKQIALEKAQAALEEARNQKTISIFRENQGFVYEADQSSVTEKQQAVSDAKREEEIQKLTEQKERIQSEADDMKSQLEDVLHDLDGSNKKTWDDIQDEINDVIDNVDNVFRTHTSKTKSYYNDIDNALDESTENINEDYQRQLDSAQNYFNEIQELQPKIVAQNNKIANSFQHIADALYNMNGQYDRMGRAIRYAEENREQANIDYNEFNKSMKEDHQTIKYASGTSYSVGGLAQTDEEGYEWKLKPAGSGKYTVFDEGSMVFSAEATKNLWNLANNPQLAMLKAGLQNKVNVPNVTNKNSSVSFTIEKGAIVLHEVKDPDQLSEAIITKLPNQILQDLYKH